MPSFVSTQHLALPLCRIRAVVSVVSFPVFGEELQQNSVTRKKEAFPVNLNTDRSEKAGRTSNSSCGSILYSLLSMGSRLGACMQCVRFLLFAFNVIFWILGLGVLAVGIWARVSLAYYMKLSSDDYAGAAYLLIGAGVLITLIGFIGCCGAYRENVCMLKMFAFILALLFLVELGGAITGYVFRREIKQGLEKGLHAALDDYPTEGIREAWDGIQENLKCCGNANFTDWIGKRNTANTWFNDSVPLSCCKKRTTGCNANITSAKHTSDIHTKGCYSEGIAFVESRFAIIGGCALGIALFQLIGIGLTCCLASAVKHSLKYEPV